MKNLTIDNLGMNFEGIAREEGKVYFVPNALIGEEVEAEIVEAKTKFTNCKLNKVITKSPERVDAFCPYFEKCGGCNLQHMNYASQLKYKTQHIKETIKKVAGLEVEVLDTIASKKAYFYRNKGAFPVVNGEIGMFENNSHNLIAISQCMLMKDEITSALKIIRKYIKQNNLKGYDFKTNKGDIKFAVIRTVNNQTLVCLVGTKMLPNLEDLYIDLLNELKQIGLYLNINTQKNSTILGKDYIYINGIKKIDLEEFDINYQIDIASFLQVNDDIKKSLYSKVASEIENQIVIDAYAGAGLMSAMLSRTAKKVYSVEIVKEASANAKNLKVLNNINNLEVVNGDCAKVVPEIAKEIKTNFSIVLDPAHVGCDLKVIEVSKLADKIIYISCNPIALAKDLKILSLTHDIVYIQPYDMFPQTKHLETLVVLTKK